ncbi:MAG TPA: helix-turn-helix domain-containing protein [Advenella sp.]|nr:helix-turn-helix domain-containing protein [Advenella sp.]
MDSLTAACARMLAAGDVLNAMKLVALRNDPPALALRGVAMARLGDYARARDLLAQAARKFGANEPVQRARCIVAGAEVALAMRQLDSPSHALAAALATLQARNDHANALQARLIMARRFLLLGRLEDASACVRDLDTNGVPASLAAVAELVQAELALRSLHMERAHIALRRAQAAADQATIAALQAEVAAMQKTLMRPAARLLTAHDDKTLTLAEVADLLSSRALVVDGCRRGISVDGTWLPLLRRPILFELVRALASAWPGDVARQSLIATVFRLHDPDESQRARLRVEMGRLRKLVRPLARIEATRDGYAFVPLDNRRTVVLAPPIDSDAAALLALLADGAPWSTSALALALGASQRTVQRTLAELQASGQVHAVGKSRVRRWVSSSLAGFTTILLLPSVLALK